MKLKFSPSTSADSSQHIDFLSDTLENETMTQDYFEIDVGLC